MAKKKSGKDGHWMEKAFAKNKGALHKSLGVPKDETIPMDELLQAANSSDLKKKRRAQAAINARKSARKTK